MDRRAEIESHYVPFIWKLLTTTPAEGVEGRLLVKERNLTKKGVPL